MSTSSSGGPADGGIRVKWTAWALLLAAIVATVLLVRADGVTAADCDKEEVEVGIVKATGCFKARTIQGDPTPVYDATTKFRMNGFDVTPHDGTKVTFTTITDKRSGSVTTNNGFVDLSATHPTFGAVHFNNMVFAFSPPKSGEMTLSENALAQPFMAIAGLSPVGVKQPITLSEGEAGFELHFALEGFAKTLVTKTEKDLAAGVGFTVKDGAYRITSGKFKLGDFDLAEIVKIDEAEVEFSAEKIAVDFDGMFKAVNGRTGVIGGWELEDNQLKRARLGVSNINVQLGTSGIYLQKLGVEVNPFPPYGGGGLIGVSAGPKENFFGHEVSAMEADGSVNIRAADDKKNLPGYLKVAGNFSLLSLPVANANFGYYFGQGTEFGASIGIGLPSATNDPGQPTYVGGGFNGWTTARNFDLEGNARLKLIGIDLLGAQTVISDYGMAGCLQVALWVGGGVRWSDGRGEVLGGFTCDLGGYRRNRVAMRGLGDGSTTVPLRNHHRVVRVRAADGEDAPQVTLEHPDGRVLAAPEPDDEDGILTADEGVSMSDENGMTAFIIPRKAGGRWQLTEQLGSSEVVEVSYASELPDHEVDAEIRGKGRKKTLRWSAADIKHQRLQFSEVLPNGREVVIFETGRPSGKRRFIPVEGNGTYNRKRKLEVDVMQRLYTPRDELVTDTYRVKRLPKPRAPRRIRAERRLTDVVANWSRVRGARAYEVEADVAARGATYRKVVGPNKRRAVIRGVATAKNLDVSVRAINAQDRKGRRAWFRIDTHRVVKTGREALRKAVRHARLVGAGRPRLATHLDCPEGAHCDGRIVLEHRGRRLGAADFNIPGGMGDRVVVRLPGKASAAIRRRGGLRNAVIRAHLGGVRPETTHARRADLPLR